MTSLLVIAVGLIGFIAGRVTATPVTPPSTTPTPDPCATIYQASKDLNAKSGWDSSAKARASAHLVADHPDCFDAVTVALAKTFLDLPAGQ